MDALPSGSHLFITHFCRSGPHAVAMEQDFLKFLGTGWFRTKEQIQNISTGSRCSDASPVVRRRER